MDTRTCHKGQVIFRQNDDGQCMYCVQYGKVGIFLDYGGPDEVMLAELMSDQFFGEMGLLEHLPRSATAVALTDDTVIETITEEGFDSYFEENPAKVLMLLQQMCSRLRRTTRDYLRACSTVREEVETEKTGKPRSKSLLKRIADYCELFRSMGSASIN